MSIFAWLHWTKKLIRFPYRFDTQSRNAAPLLESTRLAVDIAIALLYGYLLVAIIETSDHPGRNISHVFVGLSIVSALYAAWGLLMRLSYPAKANEDERPVSSWKKPVSSWKKEAVQFLTAFALALVYFFVHRSTVGIGVSNMRIVNTCFLMLSLLAVITFRVDYTVKRERNGEAAAETTVV